MRLGDTAEDLARLKRSFTTPCDAVAYIMDTIPIVAPQGGGELRWRLPPRTLRHHAGVHPHRPALPDPPRLATSGAEVLPSAGEPESRDREPLWPSRCQI